MSLNSLPAEIIAKIAKKMPYCDRLNLMATSQKQAIIGQKYRLQYKYLRVKELAIYGETDNIVSVDIYPLPSSDYDSQRPIADSRRLTTTLDKLPSILTEMWSIEEFEIINLLITPDLIKKIIKHKNKMDTFKMAYCLFQTKTDFHSLTDCFNKLRFSSFCFPIPHEQITETDDIFTVEFLLSEETLQKVLPRSILFCFLYFNNFQKRSLSNGINLTDRFLHEILLKCWPMEFTLRECRTSFTLQGVLHFIKLAEAICSVENQCNLGCFFVENKQDAVLKMTEFAKEFNYELVIDRYIESSIDFPSDFSLVEIELPPIGNYGERPFYIFTILYNQE